jgi:N-acetylneuraminic acid mutarotase
MKIGRLSLLGLLLIFSLSITFNSCNKMNAEWAELVPLPPHVPGAVQPGVAGPFAGLHGNTLIVAGGANFPDTMPWHGGRKKYHNEIYMLQLPSGMEDWKVMAGSDGFPRPVAYGASASVKAGVVCMGGETESGMTDEVCIISVAGGRPLITPLPHLPVPLSGAAAAAAGSVVYIAGGQSPYGSSRSLWSLDTEEISSGWKKHAEMPLPLINSVMAAVEGDDLTIWMIGGRTRGEGDHTSVIRPEIFRYSPAADRWTLEGDLTGVTGVMPLAAGTGAAIDNRYVALFGGNDGSVFNRVEAVLSDMVTESDTTRMKELKDEYISLQESHPGFSRAVVILDTETGKCTQAGEVPGPAQVTTIAVQTPWGIVIPSGEIKPGVRTTTVRMATFR